MRGSIGTMMGVQVNIWMPISLDRRSIYLASFQSSYTKMKYLLILSASYE